MTQVFFHITLHVGLLWQQAVQMPSSQTTNQHSQHNLSWQQLCMKLAADKEGTCITWGSHHPPCRQAKAHPVYFSACALGSCWQHACSGWRHFSCPEIWKQCHLPAWTGAVCQHQTSLKKKVKLLAALPRCCEWWCQCWLFFDSHAVWDWSIQQCTFLWHLDMLPMVSTYWAAVWCRHKRQQKDVKLSFNCMHLPDALFASFGCDKCHCQMQGTDDWTWHVQGCTYYEWVRSAHMYVWNTVKRQIFVWTWYTHAQYLYVSVQHMMCM